MSLWEQTRVTDLIREILRSQPHDPQYGTGRPFLATYQIAIEFEQQFASRVEKTHSTFTSPPGLGRYNGRFS